MGKHVAPFTRISIIGDADQVDTTVRTNDPNITNVGDSTGKVSVRHTMYRRIGRITAMDRVLTRVDMVPTSHERTITINGRDVTEYCK